MRNFWAFEKETQISSFENENFTGWVKKRLAFERLLLLEYISNDIS